MACWTIKVTPSVTELRKKALDRLEKALEAGTITVKVGPTGAVAFSKPMNQIDDGYADVCAYRALLATNSPALRRAVAKAEALAGRKVSQAAIGAGIHSHDGGNSWGGH